MLRAICSLAVLCAGCRGVYEHAPPPTLRLERAEPDDARDEEALATARALDDACREQLFWERALASTIDQMHTALCGTGCEVDLQSDVGPADAEASLRFARLHVACPADTLFAAGCYRFAPAPADRAARDCERSPVTVSASRTRVQGGCRGEDRSSIWAKVGEAARTGTAQVVEASIVIRQVLVAGSVDCLQPLESMRLPANMSRGPDPAARNLALSGARARAVLESIDDDRAPGLYVGLGTRVFHSGPLRGSGGERVTCDERDCPEARRVDAYFRLQASSERNVYRCPDPRLRPETALGCLERCHQRLGIRVDPAGAADPAPLPRLDPTTLVVGTLDTAPAWEQVQEATSVLVEDLGISGGAPPQCEWRDDS